ncbi:nucleotide pyrophosphohydrolase [Sulfitobacter phage phiCB2047-B]|uniref:Phosphoribosyl-ATP pyrophosphohydrolase n=1 Tax=Sulfitobacter phage phiCB2047-B TaxID=754046 RepID=M4PMZ4_9CAUD|nr:nucleotide pyrophosphohydrolase [Sulfitobacter phage phiCB2047-B]AGH07408.1 hypothetical protein SUFG_00041 [Sulfitobacter phage phiCB2047-B]
MFTEQMSREVFMAQQEFIKSMDANRDFVWWARTLVTEETKELEEAYAEDPTNLQNLFKEMADVTYVVAGFYNCMPARPHAIMTEETILEIQGIIDRAADIMSKISMEMQIPVQFVEAAFMEVHESNMSKLDENGKPIRREDGKIMKGPNYKEPDLSEVIKAFQDFQTKLKENNAQTTH